MAESNNTPRPLSTAAEERTPLLSTGGGESSAQQQAIEQSTPFPSSDAENGGSVITTACLFLSIKFTTYISLTASVISLALLLATYIIGQLSPYGPGGWMAEELVTQLGSFMFFSTILSILNLSTLLHSSRHPSTVNSRLYLTPRSTFFWLPINLFIDLFFVIFIWSIAVRLPLQAYLRRYCPYDINFPSQDCMRWRLALRILYGSSTFTSVVVGLSHLVLFVLRCLTAFRSGLWSGPIPWNLPATGLTVSFTVKLLGQEGERDGRNSS